MSLKTYGDLRKYYSVSISIGKQKKHGKECHNTINFALFTEEDIDTQIIEKCIIPEFHRMQRFANHLFWNCLVPFLEKEKALLCPKKLKLILKVITEDR